MCMCMCLCVWQGVGGVEASYAFLPSTLACLPLSLSRSCVSCHATYWVFMGVASDIPSRHNLTANSISVSHNLSSSSCSVSWVLGVEILEASIGVVRDNSACWLVVAFSNGVCLLRREVPLVRGKDDTSLWDYSCVPFHLTTRVTILNSMLFQPMWCCLWSMSGVTLHLDKTEMKWEGGCERCQSFLPRLCAYL